LLKGGDGLRITETDTGELIINGISLSAKQTEIVKYDGNIVVSASAGTGKTRTMVSKIVYDLERNKSHRVIAAITFTIKATEEIRERLVVDVSQNFIGTNNTFAIEEVIKPFMKDVYGEKFDIDFDTDYTNSDHFFDTFDEGMELMRSNGAIYSYCARRNCSVHNKNCSANPRNFVFELALDIVKKSKACRLFLDSKYFGLYIDEYQDCDGEMHDFFLYLCRNIGIRTFIVGDDKQAIYRWRGAKPKLFLSVTNSKDFKHIVLSQNHRSSLGIQNYSNILFNHTAGLYQQTNNKHDIFIVHKNVEDWASTVLSLLDKTHTTAILRNYKDTCYFGKGNAKDDAETLTRSGLSFVYVPEAPVEEITTTAAWIYMATARYILLDNFTEYDFMQEVPSEGDMEKKTVNAVKKRLEKVKDKVSEAEQFKAAFTSLLTYFNHPSPDDTHLNKLLKTITDPQYVVSLAEELPLHSTMTLFKSKGLEFEQAIIFFEDYAHKGNITEEHLSNHYVACTRAKRRLIIVSTQHSDSGAFVKKLKDELMANIDLKDLLTIVPKP
jgi:superfamily I DNA/RNA helicase